jgi:hypothetical protein
MKDITPLHLRCEIAATCPSIHELEDGDSYLVVGKKAPVNFDGKAYFHIPIGDDETAIIIDKALLSTIRDEVRRNCVKAIEAELAKERGGYDPSKEYTAGQMHEAYFTAGHRAIAAICALKETPHE